jgi:hypothetical protein
MTVFRTPTDRDMAPIAIGGRTDDVADKKPVTEARTIEGI